MVVRRLYIALAVLILALPGLILFSACPVSGPGAEPKAAIVDQLYSLHPNPEFVADMTALLEGYGLEVDLYQGDEVDVEFYRELPEGGYRIIVLRAHSGLLALRESPDVMAKETTFLFTDELYSERTHVLEQLGDEMVPAEMSTDYPLVFAVNSKFILESMEGSFSKTAIITMGCSTLCLEDMAAAFYLKGASTCLGWDRFVSISHVDEATLYLVQRLCLDGLTVAEAVEATMTEKGADPVFDAILNYYPPQSGDRTITELIAAE
jgi:hypothetical protein